MSKGRVARAAQVRNWFGRAERLSRPESIAVLLSVGTLTVLDLIGIIASNGAELLSQLFSIATTLTLALYIWSPVWATSVLGIVVALSFTSGNILNTLIAASIAALLVMRLASAPLITAYIGGLLIFTAFLASGLGPPDVLPTDVGAYLIIATIAGALGLALRLAYARGHRLEDELAEQAEHEREAILAERRWIAGELHDSIAHHLTIVSLHTQLLEDQKMRPISQEAIRVAARKALSDLRFVIKLAEDAPNSNEELSGDLAAAIEEARSEFEAAGHTTTLDGDPTDEMIPRGVEIILARVVREAATNVIKYAGPGDVRFALDLQTDAIALEISSPLSSSTPRVHSSTGTGINRMAERVLGVSGEFSAGPVDDTWVVAARLPITTGEKDRSDEPPVRQAAS